MTEDCAGATIPWIADPVHGLCGPFRRNVQVLLGGLGREHRVQGGAWRGRAWTLALAPGRPLHVYEERFDSGERGGCEQCRCNGWQHHPVSVHKYHFIIPTTLQLPDACVLPIDAKSGDARQASVSLESKHHVLHGVLHSNGYGHLLRINGVEGGSGNLPGREVMAFWDGLCGALRARAVSIEDVSSRRGMLLRVLHAAAHGRTWYGEWGYAFGRAGYNIQRADWQSAVEVVNGAPLRGLLEDFRGRGVDDIVVGIVERYRGRGPEEVTTLGDLLKRVIEFLHDPERGRRFLAAQSAAAAAQPGVPGSDEARSGRAAEASAPHQQAVAQALPQVKAILELAGLQVAELLRQGSGADQVQAQVLTPAEALFSPSLRSLLSKNACCGDGPVGDGAMKSLHSVKEEAWGSVVCSLNGVKGEPVLECQEPSFNTPQNRGTETGVQGVESASGSSGLGVALGQLQKAARAWVNDGKPTDVKKCCESANGPNGTALLPTMKMAGQYEGDGLWKSLDTGTRSAQPAPSRQSSNGFQQRASMGTGAQGGKQGPQGSWTAEGSIDTDLLSALQALGKQGDAWQQAAAAKDPRLLAALQLAIKELESQENGGSQDAKRALNGGPSTHSTKVQKRSDTTGRWVSLEQKSVSLESLPVEIPTHTSYGRTSGDVPRQPVTAPPKVMHKRRQPAAPVNGEPMASCSSGAHTHENNVSKSSPTKPEVGSWAVKNPLNGRFKQKQKPPVSFNGAYEPPTDLVKPPVKPFDPKLLLQGPRNWSAHKLVEFLRIVLSVLQTIEGHWVKLQELRELLYATAHDRVLADWVLGRLANTTFANGYVVYKTRSESGRRNFFLFEALKPRRGRPKPSDCGPPAPNGARPLGDAAPPASRFDKFLSDIFKWLCANPNVQVGKPTVSKRPPGDEQDMRIGDHDSEDLQRVTRSRTEAAMMRELRQLEPEKNLLENLASARARERRKRPGPGDHGYSRPAKKSRGAAGRGARGSARAAAALLPSAVEPFLEALDHKGVVPGGSAQDSFASAGATTQSLKDQQMADLIYMYQNVLESYMPLYFQDGKFNAEATPEGASMLRLAKLPDAVQLLMDTKLFVKEYDNGPNLILPQKPGDPRLVMVMCQVDVVPQLPKGYKDRFGPSKSGKVPAFFTQKPPPLAVYVPERCDLDEVKRCIKCAFKETYLMFKDWSVVHIHGLRFGGRKSRLMPVEDGVVVKVKGKDIHNEPEMRHAGGIEDWEVSCRCGTEDDDGERMVACDQCGVWMHVRCAGFRSEDDIPELFECPKCIAKRSEAASYMDQ